MNKIDLNNYKNIQHLVWYILRETKTNKLPVDIIHICKELNIKIRYYDNNSEIAKTYKDGFSYITEDNEKIIFFNKSVNNSCRNRFTIAHELGHILLEHSKDKTKTYNEMETAANIFAIRLLAPLCVLKEMNISSSEELSQLCNISKTAGTYRYERLQKALIKNKFYVNPKEKKILQQFNNYINSFSRDI